MKFKKAIKFLVPAIFVAGLSVSLPLALTSCSDSKDESKQEETIVSPDYNEETKIDKLEDVELSVEAPTNSTYQWQFKKAQSSFVTLTDDNDGWVNIPNATEKSFSIGKEYIFNKTVENDDEFRCVVTLDGKSTTTEPTKVVINNDVITADPITQITSDGISTFKSGSVGTLNQTAIQKAYEENKELNTDSGDDKLVLQKGNLFQEIIKNLISTETKNDDEELDQTFSDVISLVETITLEKQGTFRTNKVVNVTIDLKQKDDGKPSHTWSTSVFANEKDGNYKVNNKNQLVIENVETGIETDDQESNAIEFDKEKFVQSIQKLNYTQIKEQLDSTNVNNFVVDSNSGITNVDDIEKVTISQSKKPVNKHFAIDVTIELKDKEFQSGSEATEKSLTIENIETGILLPTITANYSVTKNDVEKENESVIYIGDSITINASDISTNNNDAINDFELVWLKDGQEVQVPSYYEIDAQSKFEINNVQESNRGTYSVGLKQTNVDENTILIDSSSAGFNLNPIVKPSETAQKVGKDISKTEIDPIVEQLGQWDTKMTSEEVKKQVEINSDKYDLIFESLKTKLTTIVDSQTKEDDEESTITLQNVIKDSFINLNEDGNKVNASLTITLNEDYIFADYTKDGDNKISDTNAEYTSSSVLVISDIETSIKVSNVYDSSNVNTIVTQISELFKNQNIKAGSDQNIEADDLTKLQNAFGVNKITNATYTIASGTTRSNEPTLSLSFTSDENYIDLASQIIGDAGFAISNNVFTLSGIQLTDAVIVEGEIIETSFNDQTFQNLIEKIQSYQFNSTDFNSNSYTTSLNALEATIGEGWSTASDDIKDIVITLNTENKSQTATAKINLKDNKYFATRSGATGVSNVTYTDNGASLTIDNLTLSNYTVVNTWDKANSTKIVDEVTKKFVNRNFVDKQEIDIESLVNNVLNSSKESSIPVDNANLVVSQAQAKDGTLIATITIQVSEDYKLQDEPQQSKESAITTTVKNNLVTISGFELTNAKVVGAGTTLVGENINQSTIANIATKLSNQEFEFIKGTNEPVELTKDNAKGNPDLVSLFKFINNSLFGTQQGETHDDAKDDLTDVVVNKLTFNKSLSKNGTTTNVDLSIELDGGVAFANNGSIDTSSLSESSIVANYGEQTNALEIKSIPLNVQVISVINVNTNDVISSINNELSSLNKTYVSNSEKEVPTNVETAIKKAITGKFSGVNVETNVTIQDEQVDQKSTSLGEEVKFTVTVNLNQENSKFDYDKESKTAEFTTKNDKQFVISNITSSQVVYGSKVDTTTFENSINEWTQKSLNVDSTLMGSQEITINGASEYSSLSIIDNKEILGNELSLSGLPNGSTIKFDLANDSGKVKISNLTITLPKDYYFNNNQPTQEQEDSSLTTQITQSEYKVTNEIKTNWTIMTSVSDTNIKTTLDSNVEKNKKAIVEAGTKTYTKGSASRENDTIDSIKDTILSGLDSNIVNNLLEVTVTVEKDQSQTTKEEPSTEQKAYNITISLKLDNGYYFSSNKDSTLTLDPIKVSIENEQTGGGEQEPGQGGDNGDTSDGAGQGGSDGSTDSSEGEGTEGTPEVKANTFNTFFSKFKPF